MKKLSILTALFLPALMTCAQNSASSTQTGANPAQSSVSPMPAKGTALQRPTEVLELRENIHDFGKIPQGRPATYNFEIVNTGSVPLLLDNVHASCGCTTPEWSRAPIPAGGVAQIKVGYNALAEGSFTKTVTIIYNTNQTKVLTIRGEVYKTPPTSAPENASVELLKQTN